MIIVNIFIRIKKYWSHIMVGADVLCMPYFR